MCGTGCCSDYCDRNMRFVSKLCANQLKSNKLAPRFCGGTVEVVNAKVQVKNLLSGNLPSTGNVKGTILYDSTNNKLVVWTGTTWETVTSS